MLKNWKTILCSIFMILGICMVANAEELIVEESVEEIAEVPEEVVQVEEIAENDEEAIADQISVDALENYDMSGSLFEKITLLEQDKVVLQLEKERAQLDLELERLNAEKMKLQMELDTLSGRAEQQQQELEVAKAQLEAQAEKLKRQKENLEEEARKPVTENVSRQTKQVPSDVGARYKVINIVGVGNQLQATLEEISSGQNRKVSVGKELDGFIVKSISLTDGIIFEKDGEIESLHIGK